MKLKFGHAENTGNVETKAQSFNQEGTNSRLNLNCRVYIATHRL